MKRQLSLVVIAMALIGAMATGCSGGDSAGGKDDAPKVTPEQEAAVKDKGAVDKPKVEAPSLKMDGSK